MIRPTYIRWYSIERQCEVEDVLDRAEALSAAKTLLEAGCPYVLLRDEVLHKMTLEDATERRLQTPISLGEELTAHVIASEVGELLERLGKGSKSA